MYARALMSLLKQAYYLLMSNQGQMEFQLKVINVSLYVVSVDYSLYTGGKLYFIKLQTECILGTPS